MQTITADTGDGYINSENTAWNTLHDATTGTNVNSTDQRYNLTVRTTCAQVGRTYTFGIGRYFMKFDTSGISVAPSSATLKIKGFDQTSGDVIAIKGTALGGGTLATSDFNNFDGYASGWTSSDTTPYSAEVSTWTHNSYNDFTLNSDALSDMASLSTFYVVIMNHTYDYLDVVPVSGRSCASNEFNGMYFSDAGGSYVPYIDYTAAGYTHTISAVAPSDIGMVNGVATADISKVNGV